MKKWDNCYRDIQAPFEYAIVKRNLRQYGKYLAFNIGDIVKVQGSDELGILFAKKDSLYQFIFKGDYKQC